MTQGGTQHKDLYLYHITRVLSYTEMYVIGSIRDNIIFK